MSKLKKRASTSHSLFFATNDSKCKIVPESPNYSSSSTSIRDVSNKMKIIVDETPEDDCKLAKSASKSSNKRRHSSKLKCQIPNDINDEEIDDTFASVTPDIFLKKKKTLASILESEFSFVNRLKADKDNNSSMVSTAYDYEAFENNLNKSNIKRRKSLSLESHKNKRLQKRKSCLPLSFIQEASPLSKSRNDNAQTTPKNRSSSTEIDPIINNLPSIPVIRSIDNLENGKIITASKTASKDETKSKTILFDDESLDLTIGNRIDIETIHSNENGISVTKHLDFSNSDDEYEQINSRNKNPLKDVVAYVEVRSGTANRSECIKDVLRNLGASISDKLTPDVTHVIFKDGSKPIFDKAKKQGLPILSSLWVEECRLKGRKVSEDLYPSLSLEKYQKELKIRRQRSLQPKSFEEQEAEAAAKIQRRWKRQQKNNKEVDDLSIPTPKQTEKEAQDINSPLFGIAHLITPKRGTGGKSPHTSLSTSDDEFSTPLATRMYNKIVADHFSSPAGKEKPSPINNTLSRFDRYRSKDYSGKENRIESPRKNSGVEVANKSDTSHGELRLFDNVPTILVEHCTSISSQCSDKNSLHSGSNSVNSPRKGRIQSVDLNSNETFTDSENNTKEPINENVEVLNDNYSTTVSKTPVTNRKRSFISTTPITNRRRSMRIENKMSQKEIKQVENQGTSPNKKIYPRPKNATTNPIENLSKDLSKSSFFKDGQESTIGSQNIGTNLTLQSNKSYKRKLHNVDEFPITQEVLMPSTPEYNNQISLNSVNYSELLSQGDKCPQGRRRSTLFNKKSISKQGSIAGVLTEEEEASTTEDEQQKTNDLDDSVFMLSAVNKRSVSRVSNKGKTTAKRKEITGLCLTSFHNNELRTIYPIIKKLGGFEVKDNVDETTTHVICGKERRTLNALFGLAYGCWILDVSWLYESVEFGKWTTEEPFELFNYFPAAKINRERRLKAGTAYKTTLFSSVGSIYISDDCSPPPSELKKLMSLCGAKIVQDTRAANMIICCSITKFIQLKKKIKCISAKWALDCIQGHNIFPLDNYIIK